jgi:hypothetical protein
MTPGTRRTNNHSSRVAGKKKPDAASKRQAIATPVVTPAFLPAPPPQKPTASPSQQPKASPLRRPATSPSQQPKKSAAAPLPRRVPAKSAAKAKAVFANFSLSKFAGGAPPPNYVDAGQSPTALQQQLVSNQLTQLPAAPNRVLTVAMPDAVLKQLLPSYNPKTGTVNLDEVMNALEQNTRGAEFFANGNPTLNRLDIQSQAQEIIQSVIQGAKK